MKAAIENPRFRRQCKILDTVVKKYKLRDYYHRNVLLWLSLKCIERNQFIILNSLT